MSVGMKKKKLKSKVVGLILITFAVIISSIVLWQLNEGKRVAEKLTSQAVQSVQQDSQAGREDKSSTGETSQGETSQSETSLGNTGNPPTPPEGAAHNNVEVEGSGNLPEAQGNSNEIKPATSETGTSKVNYKELVASTYSNTLQTMENVKANTLALQSRDISLASYRASINQAHQNFEAYEDFLRKNPPSDPTLKTSYQDFLSGVAIARESMGVVLSGISSLNPSSLYAAKDMGKTAREKVVNAYRNF